MSSKRALRIIMLLSLMAMLLSCDVFLTSKLGRWNTEDPNAELEPYSRILNPKIDGYLGSAVSWDETGPELKVRGDKCALLEFTITELPDIITVAELQLYCSGGGGDSYISVHRILKSWDARPVDWTTVTSAGFFDPDPIAVTYLNTTGLLYSWDMKDAVSSLTYGILLIGDDSDERRLASMEELVKPIPTLIIEGYNKL